MGDDGSVLYVNPMGHLLDSRRFLVRAHGLSMGLPLVFDGDNMVLVHGTLTVHPRATQG